MRQRGVRPGQIAGQIGLPTKVESFREFLHADRRKLMALRMACLRLQRRLLLNPPPLRCCTMHRDGTTVDC